MVSIEPTVTFPAATITSLIAASLRLINTGVSTLPIDDLSSVVTHLQHTNAVVCHAVRRANLALASTQSVPIDNLESESQELSDLADFLECMTTDGEGISFSNFTC